MLRGRALVLSATALACVLLLLSGVAPALAGGDGEMNPACGDATVRDYLAPLRRMRDLREIPDSGQLPFAPRGVLLRVSDDGLRVGPGAIGFALVDNAVDQDRRLNWRITAKLVRVDRAGRPGRLLKARAWHLGTVDLRDDVEAMRLAVDGRPSFYRIDITFGTTGGKRLGSYAEYFRVVRRSVDVDLALSSKSIQQGQSLRARVENRGTESVVPASLTYLEQFEDHEWRSVSSHLTPGLRPWIRAVLPAGRAARCVEIRIPTEQRAGPYRIINKVALRRGPSQVIISKVFHVVPSAP